MKRTVTIAALAALPVIAAGALVPANAASAPTTAVHATCAGGISIRANSYPTDGPTDNVWIAEVFTRGVPSWSVGYFTDHTRELLSVPQDGRRHRVQVWVHSASAAAGDSVRLSKVTRRCAA